MTFLDLRVRVSTWLKDKNNGFHTVTDVNSYINDAMREVHKLLVDAAQNFYFKCGKTSLVPLACDYFLPSDLIKVDRVELILSTSGGLDVTKPLSPISLNEQDNYNQLTGIPDYYCLFANTIRLFPTPSGTEKLKITYTHRLADMVNDGDIPNIPEEFQEMIALLASLSGLITDGESNPRLESKIDLYMKTMKQSAASRVRQSGRRVIMAGGGNEE